MKKKAEWQKFDDEFDKQRLAKDDGFGEWGWDKFWEFFSTKYKLPFNGLLIKWQNCKHFNVVIARSIRMILKITLTAYPNLPIPGRRKMISGYARNAIWITGIRNICVRGNIK